MKHIIILFSLLLLPSCANKQAAHSDLKNNERIVFGRVMYAEELYDGNNLGREKPGALEKIASNWNNESIKGILTLCFDKPKEFKEECKSFPTRDLDPRDHVGKNKSTLYEGKNLFSFKLSSDELKLTKIIVASNNYELTKAPVIKFSEASKVTYIGDLLIFFKKETPPRLSINTVTFLTDASKQLGDKTDIPNGTRIDSEYFDFKDVGYKVQKTLSKF